MVEVKAKEERARFRWFQGEVGIIILDDDDALK